MNWISISLGRMREKAVAIALRNRYRRRMLPEIREDVAPKNILMIGATGVGKTEIARQSLPCFPS